MNACATVGSAYATFNVPGIHSSRTDLRNLNIEVVVAKFPIPSVSKKDITNPTAEWKPVAGGSSAIRPAACALRTCQRQAAMNQIVTAPRARKISVLGLVMGAEPNCRPAGQRAGAP